MRNLAARPLTSVPYLSDFSYRGYFRHSIPESIKVSFSSAKFFVENEVSSFKPDIVVTGPVDHSFNYLLCESASEKGIPVLSLQTSFMSDHFIIHSQGKNWIEYFNTCPLPDFTPGSFPVQRPAPRSAPVHKITWKLPIFIRGGERLFRLATGGVSFDTWEVFASLAIKKFFHRRWFPCLPALKSIRDVADDYILVALNLPGYTQSESLTWIDLIVAALDAAPEEVPIVLRPHPSEQARPLPEHLQRRICSRKNVFVSIASVGPSLKSVLASCRVLLTLNSAVGMEGLLEGKPVFTFAPAFYARKGLATAVNSANLGSFKDMIQNYQRYCPDPKEVNKFTQWLLTEHAVVAQPADADPAERSLVSYIERAALPEERCL